MPTIRKKRDDLPALSKKRIEELKSIPDDKIDFSDIPELDEEFWENAEWVEPDKTQPLTIRVKESVLDYCKAGGKGYQTRINAVLESYVRARQANRVLNVHTVDTNLPNNSQTRIVS
ncbi:MAG: BrnA antitoxin family protein [Nitrospirales bacterium]|nr:BrnA antitoxin family protein [Nitrospira sp.]MDR4500753.1 BrnA antitoxin family protein [Nitrospirales bacterium]